MLLSIVLLVGLAAAQPADIEAEARRIEGEVIATCCWSQQVSIHQSPAADEMRTDIRRRLRAGESRQQILDAYVAQHGTRVLAVPPAKGFNALLYALPVILFFATAALLFRFVRRRSAAQDEPVPAGVSSTDEQALDDQLRDLD